MRSRRSVLVLDAGEPRNAPAGHVHNFLTRDGASPAEIYAAGRDEVTRYGGSVRTARVSLVHRTADGFDVETDGATFTARRVLVASGVRDALPDIPGLAERWGSDVLHCPYCHGWEVRDQRIGVLVTGPMATHQALLFRQLSAHVTLLQHDGPAPSGEQQSQLDALGVPVVGGSVVGVESGPDGLSGVRLADGSTLALDALVVAPRVTARADMLVALGLEPVDVLIGEHSIGTRIESDATGATSVPGVWVAGNVTDLQAQVVSSAAVGLAAGAAINADLIAQDVSAAREAQRREQIYGERAWDERYRSRPQNWSGDRRRRPSVSS